MDLRDLLLLLMIAEHQEPKKDKTKIWDNILMGIDILFSFIAIGTIIWLIVSKTI